MSAAQASWKQIDRPIVQAGLGGGLAGGRLAGAVSAAGGLGTVGMFGPRRLFAELALAKAIAPGKPVAANLLAPFLKEGHLTACIAQEVALVVLHGGWPAKAIAKLRSRGIPVFATVGTPGQARSALAAGATGLVVQGREAGGHLVGVEPAEAAVRRIAGEVPEVPLLAAGGVATGGDVARLLEAGARAVVAGTRFLLTEECAAHPLYKERVLAAQRTVTTSLFGFGWPLLHRVVENEAVRRWCGPDGSPARPLAALNGRSGALARALPLGAAPYLARLQRPALPLFSPAPPLASMPAGSVEATALYAGESAARISDILPAAQAVELLCR